MSAKKDFEKYCKRAGIKPNGQFAAEQKPAFYAGWRAGVKAERLVWVDCIEELQQEAE